MAAETAAGSPRKAQGKSSSKPALAPRSITARSKITNGAAVLPNIDGRTRLARRIHDILSAIIADQGGADRLAETRLNLLRRFAGASALAEQIEADMVRGQEIDISTYSTLISTAVRVAQRIGIDRRARTVVPDLHDYLDGKAEPVE